ncbi:hypothetical protein SJAV_14980 [Sulfurisphaera javensis]|uniref:Uncharacterized protein n=1 Tax=Sulfurisphaera javensis TaxID=2049879 RepID=A0AAT9GSA6_9CREN
MNTSTLVAISILLIALPVIPAYLLNFPVFVALSTVDLVIVLYLMITYKTWTTLKSRIIGLYFSGVFALGITLGIFFALPIKPRLFAEIGLIYVLPFIFQFIISIKPFIAKIISKNFLGFGNGYVAFLLVLIIGAIIGRFLANFYQFIVLYSGTILIGILILLYLRK